MYTRKMIIEEVFESTILGKIVGAHCSRLTAIVVPGLFNRAQHRQNIEAYGASERGLLSLLLSGRREQSAKGQMKLCLL